MIAGMVGFVLALPALRVTGPYLAMVTIAFAFIVQHGATEWRDLTGGANGLMNIKPPAIGGTVFAEREMAMLSILLAGVSLYFFYRLSRSAWGKGMVAVRDAEIAARSIGLNPVIMKTSAFALSACSPGSPARSSRRCSCSSRRIRFRSRNRSCFCSPSSSAAQAGCWGRWSARPSA